MEKWDLATRKFLYCLFFFHGQSWANNVLFIGHFPSKFHLHKQGIHNVQQNIGYIYLQQHLLCNYIFHFHRHILFQLIPQGYIHKLKIFQISHLKSAVSKIQNKQLTFWIREIPVAWFAFITIKSSDQIRFTRTLASFFIAHKACRPVIITLAFYE